MRGILFTNSFMYSVQSRSKFLKILEVQAWEISVLINIKILFFSSWSPADSNTLRVQVCTHLQAVGLLASVRSGSGVQNHRWWGEVWMQLSVCIHDSSGRGGTVFYCTGHHVCQHAIEGCSQLWLRGQGWVRLFTCHWVELWNWRPDDDILFFLAANTFPICPQEVAGAKSVTSEVRKTCSTICKINWPQIGLWQLLRVVLPQEILILKNTNGTLQNMMCDKISAYCTFCLRGSAMFLRELRIFLVVFIVAANWRAFEECCLLGCGAV